MFINLCSNTDEKLVAALCSQLGGAKGTRRCASASTLDSSCFYGFILPYSLIPSVGIFIGPYIIMIAFSCFCCGSIYFFVLSLGEAKIFTEKMQFVTSTFVTF